MLEGSSMMHASSVEFLNKLNTNNFIQPGVLAQMSILVPDSSKNTEKSIISQVNVFSPALLVSKNVSTCESVLKT